MEYLAPLIAIIIPNLGCFIGSYFTKSQYRVWYEKLHLPRWKPPKVVPGIVWLLVYTKMGLASYLVWRDGGGFYGLAKQPLTLYLLQLVLNFVWPYIFFGARKMKLATAEIFCLWICIIKTMTMFYTINRVAAYLLIPYFFWISYASALTAWITLNNSNVKQ